MAGNTLDPFLQSGGRQSTRIRVLAFTAGILAALSQIVLVRELLLMCQGTESVMGLFYASWLLWAGLGCAGFGLLPCDRGERTGVIAWFMILLAAMLLPAWIWLIPWLRAGTGIVMGEGIPATRLWWAIPLLVGPIPFLLGMAAPALAAWRMPDDVRQAEPGRVASTLFAWDSLGFFVGGCGATFLFLGRVPVMPLAWGMPGLLLAVLAWLGPVRRLRTGCRILAGLFVLVAAWEIHHGKLASRLSVFRWRGMGYEMRTEAGGPGFLLLRSVASRYQQVTVLEQDDQFNLYLNGQFAFAFPDPVQAEMDVHLVAAQNPAIRKVLVVGGNPADTVREVLRYPVESVVQVDVDPVVGMLVASCTPDAWDAVMREARVQAVHDDPWRYLAGNARRFDLALLNLPAPLTLGASRYWTVEFFQRVRESLAPGGYLVLSLQTSERLSPVAARLAGSVWRTLEAVFPVVLVTAGDPLRFFAGDHTAGLTLDRKTLAERSAGMGLDTAYFHPDHFLETDLLDSLRIEQVRQRLTEQAGPVNRMQRPGLMLDALRFRALTTGESITPWDPSSGHGVLVRRGGGLVVGIMIAGLLLGLWTTHGAGRWGSSFRVQVPPLMVMVTTGCLAMSLELMLLFILQIITGAVYSLVGAVSGTFMVALAAGALTARARRFGGIVNIRRTILLTDFMLAVSACGIPLLLHGGTLAAMHPAAGIAGILLFTALTGLLAGCQFPLLVAWIDPQGGRVGGAMAGLYQADYSGAVIGCLVTGAWLVPVLGLQGAGWMLATVKLAGMLVWWIGSRRIPNPGDSRLA